MRKVLKYSLLVILFLVVGIAITGFAFINLSPQFGEAPSAELYAEYELTGHFENGIFTNLEEFNLLIDCHSVMSMLKDMINPRADIAPPRDLEVVSFAARNSDALADSTARVTWLGHSSFIIELENQTFLLDPVFGEVAAPHPLLGRKRYNSEMPIELDRIGQVDAILISHDHYDHLDYPTIQALKDRTSRFLVPLGIGSHLRSWGISPSAIVELDWWQETSIGNVQFVLAPAKHMSGRGLTDQFATLWGSWILMGTTTRIYYSGDGGYGSHFKEVGERYGPFDLGLMECGQYDELWPDVHMMPEETVEAGIDIQADLILPVHWGAFTLARHSWLDPAERVTVQSSNLGMPITTPQIGETVVVPSPDYPITHWWDNYRSTAAR